MESDIIRKFGNRVRLRACGLCWQGDSLLLVNHSGLRNGNFWAPPGGGIEFGQFSADALVREFTEETGLQVEPVNLQFVCEYVNPPIHAVELFFAVHQKGGSLTRGADPEMTKDNQIIKEVKFLPWRKISALPNPEKHGIFRFCRQADDLKKMTGFYRI